MNISFQRIPMFKRHEMTISRGTQQPSENLFVTLQHDNHQGIGELGLATSDTLDLNRIEESLLAFFHSRDVNNLSIQALWQQARECKLHPAAQAAFDIALWDLQGKRHGLPCHKLFGLNAASVATAVTVGINTEDVMQEQVQEILQRTQAKYLKIKLGSPEGIDVDQQIFMAAKSAAEGFHVGLRVDVNGGWSVAQSKKMLPWLAKHGVEYVEQPLAEGCEDQLPALFAKRALPIIIDESCRFSQDIARLSHCADGINIKLMKCGGLTEALRMVALAKSAGLKTMIGCMRESSVAIAAALSISSYFDYIDLDSHLNLQPDPACGINLSKGLLKTASSSGHGAKLQG